MCHNDDNNHTTLISTTSHLNPPIAWCRYVLGSFAPGRCSDCGAGNSSTEGYVCAHNMINSHAKVFRHLRDKFHFPDISFVKSALFNLNIS